MRIFWVVLLAVVCGSGVGLASSRAKFGRQPVDPLHAVFMSDRPEIAPNGADKPQARVAVEEEEFDFGDLQTGSETEHLFNISNIGEAALNLVNAGTTCAKCTLYKLDRDKLHPGESEAVKVSYKAGALGPFRQTATLMTNDPLRPRIELVVRGKVVTMLRAIPSDLVFSRINVDEPITGELRILNYSKEPLEILDYSFLQPDTAEHFKVAIEPIPAEELGQETARSGVRLRVTAGPGLPTGALRQTLHLKTNQEKSPTLDIPIEGRVDSDLSLLGAGWDANTGVLTMGAVKAGQGAKRQLYLLVRGAQRHDVKVSAGHSEPNWLHVDFGEPQDVSNGTIVKIPFTVVVPPGSPAANHMGTAQGKLGKVTLETTHPTVKQVQVYVQLSVEN
jgi:Protein of unknown function (DUF1573)